jgi:hypothetical protein
MKPGRWFRDWDTFLLIMAVGILAGLITFMANDHNPAQCHTAISHLPGRAHLIWVCSRP